MPKNMKLLAVPLVDLYDNTARFGPQLSAIPHYLSRYRFEFVDEQGRVSRVMPGGEVLDGGGGTNGCVTAHGVKSEHEDDEVDMKHIKEEIRNVENIGIEHNAR